MSNSDSPRSIMDIKSTLLLQTAKNICDKYGKVLYVLEEEPEEQIKMGGDRLNEVSKELYIVSEANVETIEKYINEIKLDKTIIVGEIGLTGEVRPIAQCEKMVNEASKLGFEDIIIPDRNQKKIINKNVNIIGTESLKDVLSKIF